MLTIRNLMSNLAAKLEAFNKLGIGRFAASALFAIKQQGNPTKKR